MRKMKGEKKAFLSYTCNRQNKRQKKKREKFKMKGKWEIPASRLYEIFQGGSPLRAPRSGPKSDAKRREYRTFPACAVHPKSQARIAKKKKRLK